MSDNGIGGDKKTCNPGSDQYGGGSEPFHCGGDYFGADESVISSTRTALESSLEVIVGASMRCKVDDIPSATR